MKFIIILSVFFTLSCFHVTAQTSTINCPNCNGAGSKTCVTCGGRGIVMWIGLYGPQWGTCGFCNGKGIATCLGCGGGGKIAINNNNNSNYGGSGNSTNNNTQTQNSSQKHFCNVCNGTGSMTKSWYVSSNYEYYCNICKQKFYHGHSHVTCTTCNGKGYW